MEECLNMAVLDSGSAKTVCSLSCLNCYLETISRSDLSLLQKFESNFGTGKFMKSKITTCIAGKDIDLKTDFI